MSNTFKRGETVKITTLMRGMDASISTVEININDINGYPIVYPSQMCDIGNQKFKYYWDNSTPYSGYSGWSGYSSFSGISGIVQSGYSGYSGYSAYVSGICTVYFNATDADNHKGTESFKIRINP